MPNNCGTQVVDDERQAITVADREACGSQSAAPPGTGLVPPEKATGNYAKVAQRVPVRIDFDRPTGQKFNAEGLLKPGLSVEPKVRVR